MDKSATQWTWEATKQEHAQLVAITIFQGLSGASNVLYALLLRSLIDCAVNGDANGFLRWSAITALLIVSQTALRSCIRWLDEHCRGGLENSLKQRLFSALLHGDYGRISAIHSAEWMNRLTSDTKVVADGCVDIIPSAAGMFAQFVGAVIVLIMLDPRLTILLIVACAGITLLTWLFRRVLKRLHKEVQLADGKLRIFLQERLSSLLTIRSFAVEDQALDEANELMGEHLTARMHRTRLSNWCNVSFSFLMSGSRLAVIVWCGYGILNHTMTLGTLTAMSQLISQIQSPLASATGYGPRWFALLASAERLAEAEDLTGSVTPARPLNEALEHYEEQLAAIGLEDVSFSYWDTGIDPSSLSKDEASAAVSHLSLELRMGEYLALTGESGCGKSTTLRLLMGAYEPDSGERYQLLKDGTRAPIDSSWRRLFAYVPQGNQLMGGTVREVVSLADPAASNDDDRLWDALSSACANKFVAELPLGLDTMLGERGTGLSEGQMQRLAVARAIFSKSPVLVLDEATSALDAQTEKDLIQSLHNLQGRTVIIITHRPAALAVCDRTLEFTPEGVRQV